MLTCDGCRRLQRLLWRGDQMNFIVREDNRASRVLQRRFGHKEDCVLLDHFGEEQSGILYSITRSQYLQSKWAPAR